MEWISPSELERGFYVCMGGFEVIVGMTPTGQEIRRTITPSGAVLLTRLGYLPHISVEQINDKSKADLLTKALVCFQASWMVVQAIARKIKHLPLTLLELNTVMHVICALLMYLLWLKKPQDVGIPTLVHDRSKSKSLGAILSIKKVLVNEPTIPESVPVIEWINEGFLWRQGGPGPNCKGFQVWSDEVDPKNIDPAVGIQYLWITFRRGFGVETRIFLEFAADNTLRESDALFLVKYCKGAVPIFGKPKLKVGWDTLSEEIQHNGSFGATKEANNMDLVGKIRSNDGQYGFIATILFPAIYGSFHLSPWNGHFPTYLERYLWRFSGVSIAIGVPTLVALSALVDKLFGTKNPFKIPLRALKWCWGLRAKDSVGKNIVLVPLLVAMGLAIGAAASLFEASVILLVCMYPLTRVYLLVEAFASLRSLPAGAYDTVDWVQMWPHW
ncbi:hypothetical protein DFH27DRAFT_530179 [Peziza echinospora]|nr:hypothetical protein DFH27DRAFT_530179 [Peziza echinospora]